MSETNNDTQVKTEAVKTDSTETNASLTSAIVKQVEFYLSNSNLPSDQFLKRLYDEKSGWVPIATIASFKRMRALCPDVQTITQALKTSDKLKLSEDEQSVTRSEPLPAAEDISKNAIVYVKGFPTTFTLDDVTKFWEENGKFPKCIRMKKDKARQFTGSAFIEFTDGEEAQEIASLEWCVPGSSDAPLLVLTRAAFFKKLKEEREKDGAADKNDETEEGDNDEVSRPSRKRKASEMEPDKKQEVVPDRVLRFTVLPATATRESIKAFLATHEAAAAWIEYSKGDATATVRLADDATQGAAAIVAAISEKKADFEGVVPALETVTGEEESQYWQTYFDRMNENKKRNTKGGRGGRGGRRGRGRGRGRGRD